MAGLLAKFLNIALIIGVSAALGIFVRSRFVHPGAHAEAAWSARALRGRVLHPPGIEFPRPRNSVLLVLSDSCSSCEENWPFYRELASRLEGKADLVAVVSEPPGAAESYVRRSGVTVRRTLSANWKALGAPTVPALLVLNEQGVVEDAWVGYLDEERQFQILSRLSTN